MITKILSLSFIILPLTASAFGTETYKITSSFTQKQNCEFTAELTSNNYTVDGYDGSTISCTSTGQTVETQTYILESGTKEFIATQSLCNSSNTLVTKDDLQYTVTVTSVDSNGVCSYATSTETLNDTAPTYSDFDSPGCDPYQLGVCNEASCEYNQEECNSLNTDPDPTDPDPTDPDPTDPDPTDPDPIAPDYNQVLQNIADNTAPISSISNTLDSFYNRYQSVSDNEEIRHQEYLTALNEISNSFDTSPIETKIDTTNTKLGDLSQQLSLQNDETNNNLSNALSTLNGIYDALFTDYYVDLGIDPGVDSDLTNTNTEMENEIDSIFNGIKKTVDLDENIQSFTFYPDTNYPILTLEIIGHNIEINFNEQPLIFIRYVIQTFGILLNIMAAFAALRIVLRSES